MIGFSDDNQSCTNLALLRQRCTKRFGKMSTNEHNRVEMMDRVVEDPLYVNPRRRLGGIGRAVVATGADTVRKGTIRTEPCKNISGVKRCQLPHSGNS